MSPPRRLLIIPLLLLVGPALLGCPPEESPPDEPVLRTERVCEDGVGPFDVYVDGQVTAIGPSANDLATGAGGLFVVESGANTVSRFDLQSAEFHPHFVDVGNERNPYALAVDEAHGELWVTNYATHTVSVADLETGAVLQEIAGAEFRNPSAIALTATFAYVANVNYRGLRDGFGEGSIAVIDRETFEVVALTPTALQNPHYLAIENFDGEDVLLVSTSGAYDIRGDRVELRSEGGLLWLPLGEGPLSSPSRHEVFPLGQLDNPTVGAPGRALLRPDLGRLYFTSSTAPVLFVFDVAEKRWIYDAATPLVLYETERDATHQGALGADGLLWVTAFNTDSLYLFDTACDKKLAGPIDLGRVSNMLEGPHAIALNDGTTGVEGYIVLSIANAIWRVRLQPTEES